MNLSEFLFTFPPGEPLTNQEAFTNRVLAGNQETSSQL